MPDDLPLDVRAHVRAPHLQVVELGPAHHRLLNRDGGELALPVRNQRRPADVAAGGEPGIWIGQICPSKCAECQSDGVLPPNLNGSRGLPTNHYCEVSPDALYRQPTTVPATFAVSLNAEPVAAVGALQLLEALARRRPANVRSHRQYR